ncbi:MAG: UDP-N-acetylmuramoyl-tripeptide--D-alanyl-D-alanine ligase, partial [Holophagales bacterium]|jgi:UDP-N-acetylmuramoyl-tripeptide--D-alanyl-D-alanine ligase|nr:UDP-N-acetylmuramoyl-tripeptide--D-alanyl-D-alanine ligase [Holophagales bacterium]
MEMGMSTPGEIQRLTEIAPPDFGIITNVGIAHLENFPNGQEGIACAKGELVAGLISGGAWVFPKDDPWCQWISKQSWASKTKPIPVGVGADFSITSIESLGLRGERFILQAPMGDLDLEIRLRGRHQIQNAALAASIALIAGFEGGEISHGLASVEPEEGRGRLYALSGGGWLLDESYNASQESMLSCASALLDLDGGEPIAVLGCMRELGSASASLHESVGSALRQVGISRLWVYGDFAMELARGFGNGANAYPDFETLRPALVELPQDARILVKGSRYWMSERAVVYLLNQFGDTERTGINNLEEVK